MSEIARPQDALLQGTDLKRATYRLMNRIEARRVQEQNQVPTAFDSLMWELMGVLSTLHPDRSWEDSCREIAGPRGEAIREALGALKAYVQRSGLGRYATYEQRLAISRCELPPRVFAMSSGVDESLKWKGMPLFKTAYDMALHTMLLWDLKPRLIVEIGSGSGASAWWMADLLRTYGIEGRILSFDFRPPTLECEGVTFLQGNCKTIERDLDLAQLEAAAGPILLIEDAHVNVAGVLKHLHPLLKQGDYVIVEDSANKQAAILDWLQACPDTYRVDCRYVDFFGQNATCSRDSIFTRIR